MTNSLTNQSTTLSPFSSKNSTEIISTLQLMQGFHYLHLFTIPFTTLIAMHIIPNTPHPPPYHLTPSFGIFAPFHYNFSFPCYHFSICSHHHLPQCSLVLLVLFISFQNIFWKSCTLFYPMSHMPSFSAHTAIIPLCTSHTLNTFHISLGISSNLTCFHNFCNTLHFLKSPQTLNSPPTQNDEIFHLLPPYACSNSTLSNWHTCT